MKRLAQWLSRMFRPATENPAEETSASSRNGEQEPLTGSLHSLASNPLILTSQDARPDATAEVMISPREGEFLAGLVRRPAQLPIGDMSKDDQAFMTGILKRVHARKLELPLMPSAAIRLNQLLRDGAAASQYAALINEDAALSIEVLRTANSAVYGGSTPVTSLQDAVVRVGLGRLQAILMTAQLRAKVLKAGSLKVESDALLDIGLPLAMLASRAARERGAAADTAYMRGILMHVEHLVIMGAVADIARDVRRVLTPSVAALHQAFAQFGPDIRRAVASEWKLSDLLLGEEGSSVTADYALLRHALIAHWLDWRLPDLDWVEPAALQKALGGLLLRVVQGERDRAIS